MNKARKQLIADFVNANGFASTTELCEKFRASRATIRRDLADLSNAGFLEAYHGGAKAIKRNEEIQAKLNGLRKEEDMYEERRGIARYCVDKLIDDGDIIMLDASRIAYHMAELLVQSGKKVTVFTNAIKICELLADGSNIDIITIGGKFARDGYCTFGKIAEQNVRQLTFDKVFVGADGVSIDKGITEFQPGTGEIKKALMSQTSKFYVYTTHNTFSVINELKVCDLDEVDEIITDYKLEDDTYNLYRKYNINLTRV